MTKEQKKRNELYQNKKCQNLECGGKNLKKRKAPPFTASTWGKASCEYWQCKKCKTNYAYVKTDD